MRRFAGAFALSLIIVLSAFVAPGGAQAAPVSGASQVSTLTRQAARIGALDPRCRYGRVMCVDKTSRTLRWVVNGQVRMIMAARFGGYATPTREGQFRVYWKHINHVSSIYHTAMPFAMFFSGGQAVHYSSDFARYGYAHSSHGCVNIRNWDKIKSLFSRVRVGDRVVVYWS